MKQRRPLMRGPEIVMNLADTKSSSDYGQSFEHPADEEMLYVPGGTYRMGSEKHYPEEAPVHHVTVDGFWVDRTPVTNRQFRRFINATGYVTFAELTPDAKDYPDALPHMLKAGSLVFTPPKQAVDLSSTSPTETSKLMPNGPARNCRPRPNGNSPRAVGWMDRNSPGATNSRLMASIWRTPGRAISRSRISRPTASSAPLPSLRFRPTATACTT